MGANNTIIIEGIPYNVEIFFKNQNGTSPSLPMDMFHEIFLEEKLFRYGFSGYFIYDDTSENLKNKVGYTHTSNGSEEIHISMTVSSSSNMDIEDNKMLNFNIIGSVVDIESLDGEGASKLKKVLFIDVYNFKASTTRKGITSSKSLSYKGTPPNPNSTNKERADFYGDIIKYALHLLDVPPKNMTYVDRGDFKKFYISKKNNTVNHTIYELLYSWSFENYPGVFIYDRITDSFLLMSLHDLFRGGYIPSKEVLTLALYPNNITKPINITTTKDQQYNMGEYSIGYNFEYTTTSPETSVDTIANIHSNIFDPTLGTFKVTTKGNTYADVVNTFNNATPDGTVPNIEVISNRNTTFENSKVEVGYGITYYVSRMIKKYIKSLESLIVTVKGLPIRRPGTFFIVEDNTTSDDDFDNTICGEWLCLKVEHRILPNNYENRLTLVKPYVHKYSKTGSDLKKNGLVLSSSPIMVIPDTVQNAINTTISNISKFGTALGNLKDAIMETPNYDDEIEHITTNAIDEIDSKVEDFLEKKQVCHSDRFAMLKEKISTRVLMVESAYIAVSNYIKGIIKAVGDAIKNFISKLFMLDMNSPLLLPIKIINEVAKIVKKIQKIIGVAKAIIEFIKNPMKLLIELEGKLLGILGNCFKGFIGSTLDEVQQAEDKITKVKDEYDKYK